MRSVYLFPRDSDSGGCRGGVGAAYDCGGSQDYELEIDHRCNASDIMLAVAAHVDEIEEYLKNSSPMGQLLWRSILKTKESLGRQP